MLTNVTETACETTTEIMIFHADGRYFTFKACFILFTISYNVKIWLGKTLANLVIVCQFAKVSTKRTFTQIFPSKYMVELFRQFYPASILYHMVYFDSISKLRVLWLKVMHYYEAT